MRKYKCFYVGLDIETPEILLNCKEFDLVSVALNRIFFLKTLNPFDLLFKGVYLLRRRGRFRQLELLLLFLWYIFGAFSSATFRKNRRFLIFLSINKITVLDIDDVDFSERFLREVGLDFIVVNAWGLLSDRILRIPKYGTINVHPSRLPKYRGALPTLWALKNGDTMTAVTYVLLGKFIDGGKIIAQHEIPLELNNSSIDVEFKIKEVVRKTLVRDIRNYLSGSIVLWEQDESVASKTGKYYEYLWINWESERVTDIYNKVALYPFLEPNLFCYFFWCGRKIHVRNANLLKVEESRYHSYDCFETGKLNIRNNFFFFKAVDGILEIRLFLDIGFKDSLFLMLNFKKRK